jgi:hypothetical protein
MPRGTFNTVACAGLATLALIAPAAATATTITESFETGLGAWATDSYLAPGAVNPLDPTWTRTTARAIDGEWSLDIGASGLNDDGSVWIERPIDLPAGTWNIVLSFFLWSPVQSDLNNWEVLAHLNTFDPETEDDFTVLGETNRDAGWIYYELDRTLTLDAPATVYAALGLNVTWETDRVYGFDDVRLTVVPAPGLAALGVVASGLIARRRRR